MRKLLEHIGADPSFSPPSLGQRVHEGGQTTRLTAEASRVLTGYLDDRWFGMLRGADRAERRAEFFHWFTRFNIVPDDERPEVSVRTRELLIRRFVEDAEGLEPIMGRLPPWGMRGQFGGGGWRAGASGAG